MGIRERLKLAEDRSASAERGGRPCLGARLARGLRDGLLFSYRTRSANAKECRGFEARRATWSLLMFAPVGWSGHGEAVALNRAVEAMCLVHLRVMGHRTLMRRESRMAGRHDILGRASIGCSLGRVLSRESPRGRL